MNTGARRAIGCTTGVILSIVLVISLVGWLLSVTGTPNPMRTLAPIPEGVPPPRGEEVARIDINMPGRTADQLTEWAEPIAAQTGIPAAAVRAYGNAELIAAQAWPQCHLSWNTLAGIGWVETRHGRYSGQLFSPSAIEADGVVRPPIIGIPLDGTNSTARVPDTDNGEWDGDIEFDRAVGPMQFIPDSWRRYGLDASGDGYADPHHIDDAVLAAAKHLCEGGHDLSTPRGWTDAVLSYNRSSDYLAKVRNAAASYAIGQPAV